MGREGKDPYSLLEQALWKKLWRFVKQTKTLICDLAVPALGIYPKICAHPCVLLFHSQQQGN